MNKHIIFIDRDGVINKVTKGKYLNKVEDLEYIDGSLEAIQKLADYSFDIYIITNQAGVAYGFLTEEELNKIHDKIMKDTNGVIKKILYCIHSKEAKCNCRKPNTKLCDDIIAIYEEPKIYVIGDAESDLELANNINANGILVLTGISTLDDVYEIYQQQKYKFYVSKNLEAAVDKIIKYNC